MRSSSVPFSSIGGSVLDEADDAADDDESHPSSASEPEDEVAEEPGMGDWGVRPLDSIAGTGGDSGSDSEGVGEELGRQL